MYDCSECIHGFPLNQRCEECEKGNMKISEGWMYLPYTFDGDPPNIKYLEFRNNYTSWYIMNDLQARARLDDDDTIVPAHVLAEGIDFMVEQGYWQ